SARSPAMVSAPAPGPSTVARSGSPLISTSSLRHPRDRLADVLDLGHLILRRLAPEHEDDPTHPGIGHLRQPFADVFGGTTDGERLDHLVGDHRPRVRVAGTDGWPERRDLVR